MIICWRSIFRLLFNYTFCLAGQWSCGQKSSQNGSKVTKKEDSVNKGVLVSFHLMASVGYKECGLVFILWQVWVIKECWSVGKRLEKFPLISQLASPTSLDDQRNPMMMRLIILVLSSTFCLTEQIGASKMLNKIKAFPKQLNAGGCYCFDSTHLRKTAQSNFWAIIAHFGPTLCSASSPCLCEWEFLGRAADVPGKTCVANSQSLLTEGKQSRF